MRAYRAADVTPTIPEASPPSMPRRGDLTRTHAINVGAGVGALALCGAVGAWGIARATGVDVDPVALAYAVPVAATGALASGAVALLRFTAEHRRAIYGWGIVDAEGAPDVTGAPGQGKPVPGTFLRAPGGVFHRVDLVLSHPEQQAVKRLLLADGKATVRALAAVVGDRASLLRGELVRLGICSQPDATRAAAALTERGREAVERW